MKKGEMVTCKNACPVTGQLSAMGKTASGNSGSKQKAIVSETKRMKRGGFDFDTKLAKFTSMDAAVHERGTSHSQSRLPDLHPFITYPDTLRHTCYYSYCIVNNILYLGAPKIMTHNNILIVFV